MTSTQAPLPRPRPALAALQAERRSRRNRRIIMAVILLLGLAVIMWDFLRPPRPPAAKPASPTIEGQR